MNAAASEPGTDDRQRTGAAVGVAVTRLSLTDFRNYPSLTLPCGPRPVVLTGPNGAGKTNILEAISLFSPGRGLRGASFAECERDAGTGGWAVAAEIDGMAGPARIGTGMVPGLAGDGAQRRCRVDGQTVRGPGSFADHLRIVWITPALDRLFAGPAGDRRRFFDRLVATVEPAHNSHLSDYERAMRERNRLLGEHRHDASWLAALEEQMAAHGTAIAATRREVTDRLRDEIAELSRLTEFPPAVLAIEGHLEGALETGAAVEAEARFQETLAAARGRDAAAGRTLDGPHRSDIVVHHGTTGSPAGRCSTGEQKALLISIILAEARLVARRVGGMAPLLLLDEIAAHLDAKRRAALFETIAAIGAQAWMTGTDAALFDTVNAGASRFAIADGTATLL